jgi:hypothetical protein
MDHYNDDYDESTRSRWLKIGALGLGAVVLAVAAFGIGRLSAPASGSGQQHATATSPSGPGPTRVENGVPVGYAHTPEGAVAAATNFDVVMTGPLNAAPDRYRAAIDIVAAPQAKGKLRSDAEKGLAGWQSLLGLASYAQQGRAIVFRTVPLSYHVNSYDNAKARVSIWAESRTPDIGMPIELIWASIGGLYVQ